MAATQTARVNSEGPAASPLLAQPDSTLAPPQPVDGIVRVTRRGDSLVLSYRQPFWVATLITGVYFAVWSVPLVMCFAGHGGDLWPRFAGIALPWFASWCILFVALTHCAFGRQRLYLGPDDLRCEWTVLIRVAHRRVPWQDLQLARVGFTPCQLGQADRREPCVVIETAGKPICFAPYVQAPEQHWLVWLINRYLATVRSAGAPAEFVGLPSDSAVHITHTAGTLAFSFRGRWSVPRMAAATLIFMFVGGIAASILIAFFAVLGWAGGLAACFTALPVVVGLLGVVAFWLGNMTAPAWRLTWAFDQHKATRSVCCFGIPWRAQHDLTGLERVALEHYEEDYRLRLGWDILGHQLALCRPEAYWGLSFLRSGGVKMFGIDGLTEGEARCMALLLTKALEQ